MKTKIPFIQLYFFPLFFSGLLFILLTFNLISREHINEKRHARLIHQLFPLADPKDIQIHKLSSEIVSLSNTIQILTYNELESSNEKWNFYDFTCTGYGGKIRLWAIFNTKKELSQLLTYSHKETPGIGDFFLFKKSNFLTQFYERFSRDASSIDSISGATITKNALTTCIESIKSYHKN